MVRNLLDAGAGEITVFSRDEKKQDEMRRSLENEKIRYFIGDVRNRASVNLAMKGIDYVFHAAALKQVPSCEFFPMEANRTNVQGTDNVCGAAGESGVKKVVCLSTDKAVYPINAMGISKALMEKVVLSHSLHRRAETDTEFCITRYGNVMASRGSVIPLFIAQAKQKLQLTVTNPHMTRFLMSLSDSVDLVHFAFGKAQSGDICVQKAPGCTLGDLAKAVNEIYSNDQGVKIIGTRHGEKLDELLLSNEEAAKAVEIEKYYIVPADERSLNYSKYFSTGEESAMTEAYTSRNTSQLTLSEIIQLINNTVLQRGATQI